MQFCCCIYLKGQIFKYSEMLRICQFIQLEDPLWEFLVSVAWLPNLSWLVVHQGQEGKSWTCLSVTNFWFPSSLQQFSSKTKHSPRALVHMGIHYQTGHSFHWIPSIHVYSCCFGWTVLVLIKHGILVTVIFPRLCTLLVSLSLGQGTCLESRNLTDCLCPAALLLQQISRWLKYPRRTRAGEHEPAPICL